MSRPISSRVHQPLPLDVVAHLSEAASLARASVVADVRLPDMPAAAATAKGLAMTLMGIETLISRLVAMGTCCASCWRTDRMIACARELGALDAHLVPLARRCRVALGRKLRDSADTDGLHLATR